MSIEDGGDKFSIIVRCKNEERWIGYCLQSIIDHISKPEIIIVDDHSTDESMEAVRLFMNHANIVLANSGNQVYSPGRVLNEAIREKAHYDHILVLSAHCVLMEFDVARCRQDLSEHDAVFGRQIPIYRGRRIGTTNGYVWSHFGSWTPVVNMISHIEKRPFLHNAFCAYNRDSWQRLPFSELLFSKEDRYWAADLVNSGGTFLYDPLLVCEHHWTSNGATWKGIA